MSLLGKVFYLHDGEGADDDCSSSSSSSSSIIIIIYHTYIIILYLQCHSYLLLSAHTCYTPGRASVCVSGGRCILQLLHIAALHGDGHRPGVPLTRTAGDCCDGCRRQRFRDGFPVSLQYS